MRVALIDVAGIDAIENGAFPGSIAVDAVVDQPRVELLLMGVHPKLLTTGETAWPSALLACANDAWWACGDDLPGHLSLQSVHDVSFRRGGRGHTFADGPCGVR